MYLRKQYFLLVLFSLVSYTAFSHELLPSNMREKVYMFFADEKIPGEHDKTIKYLVDYSEDEYFSRQMGADARASGKYSYKLNESQHGIPYGILSHDQSSDATKKVFHILFFPHDRETGIYFAMGYKMPDGTFNVVESAKDQMMPTFFQHSGKYKRLF